MFPIKDYNKSLFTLEEVYILNKSKLPFVAIHSQDLHSNSPICIKSHEVFISNLDAKIFKNLHGDKYPNNEKIWYRVKPNPVLCYCDYETIIKQFKKCYCKGE